LTQSFQAFFIISTFQTLGLFGLLEVAWIKSSSFILQAFQYFMPINLIVSSSKNNISNLSVFGFYRLNQYISSPQNIGLITIFAIDCLLFIAIVVLFVITVIKRRVEENNKSIKNDLI